MDHYRYVWDQNDMYSFTGSEASWTSGTLAVTGNARSKATWAQKVAAPIFGSTTVEEDGHEPKCRE